MKKRDLRLFTVDYLAEHLSVSDKSIRRWISTGELPHHRLGTSIRVSEEDLDAFLAVRRNR